MQKVQLTIRAAGRNFEPGDKQTARLLCC